MTDQPADELVSLRRLLKFFEDGFTLRRGNEDITQREMQILKREIAHLEEKTARNA